MDDKILDLMNNKETSRKNHRSWRKIVTTLAAIVVFCTTYMLIIPAITMENDTICGKEEHIHSENCYVKINTEEEVILDCTYETLGVHVHSDECKNEVGDLICESADYVVHEHTDMCYDAEDNLVCELPEIKAHEHTDDCYEINEETVKHVHDDSCYKIELGAVICQQEESEEHAHTVECREQINTLICGMEEGDEEETMSSEPVLVCDKADKAIHEHTEACMKTVEVPVEEYEELICGQEEHKHDESCLPEEPEVTESETNKPEAEEPELEKPELEEPESGEKEEQATEENDNQTSSEVSSEPPAYVNAWAETEGKEEEQIANSYSLKNSGGASRYVMSRSGPLDMTEWINDVTMYKHEDGKVTEIQNGAVVYEGDLIQFKLDYTIKGQKLANKVDGVISNTVIYHIPDTFKTINSNSGNIYNSDDEVVGTYVIDSESNDIIMTYDEKYVNENADGKQIHGYISFFSIVDKISEDTNEEQNHYFNSKNEVTLNVKESQEVKGDLSVGKTKSSVEGNVIKYMITVTSAEGTKGSVTLTDVMCDDLTYIDGTLSVTKNGSPVDYSVREQNNSLILTLPEMEADDRYIISYSAEANIKLQNANMEVTNTATVESKDSYDNPLKDSITVKHNFDILEKKGEPGANGTIDWTITINKSKLDISGWKLTDVLNGVEFNGPVNIYNSANVLIRENVTLPYTFPSGSTDTYYIRYTTKHSLIEGMDVTNEAKLEKNGVTITDQDGTSVGTPIEKKGKVASDEVRTDENGINWIPITWTVTIDTTAGPITAGNSLVDKLLPVETGVQEGYMTYDQIISAYYSINDVLKKELNTSEDVLSLSKSKVTVFKTGQSYTITQLLNNHNNSQTNNFETFEFVLAKDIPQGKMVSFDYTSTGIFYNNTVNNSTFTNRFSISNSYEVTAKVNYSASKLTASKRGILYFDPNINYSSQDWKSNYSEVTNLNYETLIDNYLAWIIEVDTPPDYTGKGDVTLYEDMPDGIALKRLDISEKSGERWILDGVELGKTYKLGNSPYGSYTVKVTEEGDLEIIIPESLIANHSEYANNIPEGLKEFHTLFIVYTQMTDLEWPRVNENSMITKKSFENNFTLVNADGDTITFGKNTQNITRDDSKGHVIKGYSTDDNYITYQVLLNPEGRDFDPNASTLDVNDTLVYTSTEEKLLNLELVANSVKLYEYLGKGSDGNPIKGDPVDFSYIYTEDAVTDSNKVTTKTHTIELVVPDGKKLVLEYRYRASGAKEQHSLVNTCTIESVGQGQLDDESRFEMQVTQSMAGADTAGVTIYKVDSNNYGVYLPDAKFELYIWNEDKNAYIQVTDPAGEKKTFVTDEKGKIVLDNTTMHSDYIAYNTAYKLVEVESPEGYYLLDEAYYFYIENNDLERFPPCMPGGFNGKAVNETDNVFLPNEKSFTKLEIRKQWKDYDGNDITVKADRVSEVSFELWRKTEGVDNSDVSCGVYKVTPDKNGFWEAVITNLPKGNYDEDGTKGTLKYIYYIKEVSVPGFKVVGYEYDDGDATTTDDSKGINSGTITMTNQELDGYVLPETGGIGTTPYTVGGLLLMIAALSLLSYKNKKRGKEDMTSS